MSTPASPSPIHTPAEASPTRLDGLEEKAEEPTRRPDEPDYQPAPGEKLALLAELAAEVSHELRSPLGVIKNATYLLNVLLQDSDAEVQEALRILEKEVTRAEKIVASLLDLSRARAPERRSVLVNELIREACERARVTGGESVKLTMELDATLPPIMADPDQLGRVLENLIQNALQAMPDGGRLTLKSAVSYPGWLAISVSDTGVGIAAENMEKVFDPLFTTKVKGIGLGLAIARSLVEGHEGTIVAQSQVGKGSTFTVNLPLWKTNDL